MKSPPPSPRPRPRAIISNQARPRAGIDILATPSVKVNYKKEGGGSGRRALTFRCHRRSWRSRTRQACAPVLDTRAAVRRPHEAKLMPHGAACLLRRCGALSLRSEYEGSGRGVDTRGEIGRRKARAAFLPFSFIDLDPEVRSASRRQDKKLNKRPAFINYQIKLINLKKASLWMCCFF
jgi:hypothetical protein